MHFKAFTALLLILCSFMAIAQDPARLKNDIQEVKDMEYSINPEKPVVVLAGSSSVKIWRDVQDYFPDYNMINHGFGGSEFSDLLFYYDLLIKEAKPDILFIYEGDNDIANGEKPAAIEEEARELVQRIQKDLPETRIILITAKPSIARWNYRDAYEDLNFRLEQLAEEEGIEIADVWSAMLDENGEVYNHIFLDDDLHMNRNGYQIWAEVLEQHL